jgi:outer membrane protein OmpU
MAIAAAAPAKAEGIDLGLGGYFIGYGLYNNQDEAAGNSLKSLDFRKETEVHFNGETTLDNGLTVGGHVELNADRAIDAVANNEAQGSDGRIEESYMYLSGGWGRVNFGEEDGAAYLLQVAAPSADDNIDGLRPDINTFDLSQMVAGSFPVSGVTSADGDVLNYANDSTGYANKITYITPLFSGFQAGVSFTPTIQTADEASGDAIDDDDDAGAFENAYEAAARYQATWGSMDWTLGAGYAHLSTEADGGAGTVGSDDETVWNAGARVGFGAFGLGAAYLHDDNGVDDDGDTTTMVAGADYVTGPFKIGVSYMDREDEINAPNQSGATGELDTNRWTAGVGYQYGPGMSLNGSIARVEVEDDVESGDGFQVAVGTRVDF